MVSLFEILFEMGLRLSGGQKDRITGRKSKKLGGYLSSLLANGV